MGRGVVCTGEAPLPDRLGRPDYAVHRNGLLAGYVELKAPGTGANATRFKGRDRAQFKRFSAIPNLLYADGNEWALYRGGERVGRIVRLSGDVAGEGRQAVAGEDARAVSRCCATSCPGSRSCRWIAGGGWTLRASRRCWRRCAGCCAATCPMRWRTPGLPGAAMPGTGGSFCSRTRRTRSSRMPTRRPSPSPCCWGVAREPIHSPSTVRCRAGRAAQPAVERLAGSGRPRWTRGHGGFAGPAAAGGGGGAAGCVRRSSGPVAVLLRDFLAAYDPKLRKDAGAYYTPVEVVRAQVRLVDELLVTRLNKPLGFAGPGVVTLDPRRRHRNVPAGGHRARPGAYRGGAGGGGRGGAGRGACEESLPASS